MNWLSYLTPLVVYRSCTAKKTLIEVREIFGQKKLDINGYPQSGLNYRKCWRAIFRRANIETFRENGKALVLGLGGGDVAKILDDLKPRWKVTFVEIEPEIVAVAFKYFGVGETKTRKMIVADAKRYMNHNLESCDLIVIDLYNGDEVPAFVCSPIFLKEIAKSLRQEGVAVFNYASHRFREKDFELFEKQLKKVFAKTSQVKFRGHPFYIAV